MDQWISLVGEVGFPVVVTLFLLYRIENKLDTLIHSIQSLPEKLHH
ncbi:MAG TPA: YvrJ family protein [Bacillus sp. (in: firmicutes)]|nr:YvrJ family protein [Bacillus litorisediminis]HWO77385.1 YvrJ family protein [Bacillus sp. (in: firmicutes)]